MKSGRQAAPYRLLGTFRLLLALLVVLQHALPMLPESVDAIVGPLEVGSIAVFAFFTVSGFVIGEAATVFYVGRPGAFFANRLVRLMPTYILATLAAAAAFRLGAILSGVSAETVGAMPLDAWSLRTVLVNFTAILPIWRAVQAHWPVPELMVEVWAIRVEIIFYIVMAMCLGAPQFLRVPPRALCAVAGLGVLIALLIMSDRAAGTLLEDAPFFVLGVALFFMFDRPGGRLVAGSFCVTSCIFIVSEMTRRSPTFGAGFTRDRAGEGLLLAALLSVMVLLLMARVGTSRWRWIRRFDKAAGDITYPLYLLHRPVLVLGMALLPGRAAKSAVVCLAIALVLSAATAAFIEAPIARLRSRLRGSRLDVSASPAVPSAVFHGQAGDVPSARLNA